MPYFINYTPWTTLNAFTDTCWHILNCHLKAVSTFQVTKCLTNSLATLAALKHKTWLWLRICFDIKLCARKYLFKHPHLLKRNVYLFCVPAIVLTRSLYGRAWVNEIWLDFKSICPMFFYIISVWTPSWRQNFEIIDVYCFPDSQRPSGIIYWHTYINLYMRVCQEKAFNNNAK